MTSGITRQLVLMTAGLLGAELFLLWLFPIPLLDPDEPLFACVAREMMRTGDYITPVFKGEPFYDRPAFFYWLLAISVHFLGESDFAYRLPNLLLGMGTVLFTGLIGQRLFGKEVGAASSFVLMTLVGGAILRLAVGHDGALVFFVTGTIFLGLEWFQACAEGSHRSEWLYASLAGVLAGCACLSKGLLGFALPAVALISLAYGMKLRGRWNSFLLLATTALVVGSSWFVSMHWKHPEFLRYYIWERHVLGFFTSTQRHGGKSIWVYLPAMLLAGSPWLLFLFRSRSSDNSGVARRGVWIWLLATISPFLFAGSRNPTYLLPAVPPLAILLGEALVGWLETSKLSRFDPILVKLPTVTFAVLLAAIAGAGVQFHRPLAIEIGLAGFLGGMIVLWLRRNGKTDTPTNHWRLLRAQAIASAAVTIVAVTFVIPEIAEERSARSTIVALRERVAPGTEILWFNHLPPSALYHGQGLLLRRVYYDEVSLPFGEPIVFVTRESRLEEVGQLSWIRTAEHIDLGGKYHIFVSDPRIASSTESGQGGR